MQITDILAQIGGLQSIARELGVSETQVASGAEALAPAILGGFKKQANAQTSGLEGLGGLLSQFGGGGLMDDVLGAQPTNVARGNDVLGQIFGSKDVAARSHRTRRRSQDSIRRCSRRCCRCLSAVSFRSSKAVEGASCRLR